MRCMPGDAELDLHPLRAALEAVIDRPEQAHEIERDPSAAAASADCPVAVACAHAGLLRRALGGRHGVGTTRQAPRAAARARCRAPRRRERRGPGSSRRRDGGRASRYHSATVAVAFIFSMICRQPTPVLYAQKLDLTHLRAVRDDAHLGAAEVVVEEVLEPHAGDEQDAPLELVRRRSRARRSCLPRAPVWLKNCFSSSAKRSPAARCRRRSCLSSASASSASVIARPLRRRR